MRTQRRIVTGADIKARGEIPVLTDFNYHITDNKILARFERELGHLFNRFYPVRVRWSDLKSIGDSRFIAWCCYFIFVVPLLCQLLNSLTGDESVFIIPYWYGKYYKIEFALPKYWVSLYLVGFIFVVASFIYRFRCPRVVKKYHDYNDFVNRGMIPELIVRDAAKAGLHIRLDNYLSLINDLMKQPLQEVDLFELAKKADEQYLLYMASLAGIEREQAKIRIKTLFSEGKRSEDIDAEFLDVCCKKKAKVLFWHVWNYQNTSIRNLTKYAIHMLYFAGMTIIGLLILWNAVCVFKFITV